MKRQYQILKVSESCNFKKIPIVFIIAKLKIKLSTLGANLNISKRMRIVWKMIWKCRVCIENLLNLKIKFELFIF